MEDLPGRAGRAVLVERDRRTVTSKVSHIFDVGEETVWSPALRVGKTYFSLLRSISELLGQSTGSGRFLASGGEEKGESLDRTRLRRKGRGRSSGW
ncbi:DUF6086 family protein [Streptosporangium saharense]|uniref:DUF6086 family protein n=1 Tax=Streptosporangium saharense TaxID=1706840 RepID=UPI00368D3DC4